MGHYDNCRDDPMSNPVSVGDDLVERLRAAGNGRAEPALGDCDEAADLIELYASQLAAVSAERDAALDRDWVARPAYEAAIADARAERARATTAESDVAALTRRVEELEAKYEPKVRTFEFKGKQYTATQEVGRMFYAADAVVTNVRCTRSPYPPADGTPA